MFVAYKEGVTGSSPVAPTPRNVTASPLPVSLSPKRLSKLGRGIFPAKNSDLAGVHDAATLLIRDSDA